MHRGILGASRGKKKTATMAGSFRNGMISGMNGIGNESAVTVIAMDTIRAISVPKNTPFRNINFSDYGLDYVKIALSNSKVYNLKIRWSLGNYQGNVAGTYTLYGTFAIPSFASNPLKLRPSISITVINTLDTDFQAVITYAIGQGYTLPSPINQGDINTLITGDKADSTFATRDVYYVMMTDGDSDFSRLNYKSPSTFKLAIVGGVTYTARKGFTGDGTTGYLNASWNPSTNGVNFTQNDAGFGVHSYDANAHTGILLGSVAGGARISLYNLGDRSTGYELNGNTNPVIAFDDWHAGYYHVLRAASGTIYLVKDGVTLASAVADVSVTRPNANLYILARNNGGVADNFSNNTVSCFWAGANLGALNVAIHARWQTYYMATRRPNTYGSVSTIGQKFNDTFNRASLGSAYATSNGTWSMPGTKLVASGGNSTFDRRLLFKYGQSSENCVFTAHVKTNTTPASTTTGIGMGWSDYAGLNGQRSIIAQINFSNTGGSGGFLTIWTWNGTTAVQQAISVTNFTVAINDEFDLTLAKTIGLDGLVNYTFTATRTVGGAQTVTVTYAAILGDSTGDPALFIHGSTGTVDVTLWTGTFNDKTNTDIVFIGDSLKHGAFATNLFRRYVSQIHPESYEVSAGSGDLTGDVVGSTAIVVGKIRNLMDYNAKTYALTIGGNDVAYPVSTSVWQPNLKLLINAIKQAGHRIILFTPCARHDASFPAGAPIGSLTAYYVNFPEWPISTILYDTSKEITSAKLNNDFDSGDNVHMNDNGHMTVGKAAMAALPPLWNTAKVISLG